MGVCGIIAEFNPLHNGHKYLIDRAKADGFSVVAVISGNFVQRGDVALVSKFERAIMAVDAGVDLVAELPIPWSMSTAQNFALGGISQLSAFNIDALYFGSECGDSNKLEQIAEIVLSNEFNTRLKDRLKTGETFAKIRQSLLEEYIGADASILDNPNDTLATEYICASKRLGLNIDFCAVKRQGAGHNENLPQGKFASSTMIRNAIHVGETNGLFDYMPKKSVEVLKNSAIADIKLLDTAIISSIKHLSQEELSALPDISEGLDQLVYNKARGCYSYSELCDEIKSKRYTMARIRRILLSAFLGIDNSFFLKEPPYVRVLGFSENGTSLIPREGGKPIVTRASQILELDEFSKKVFFTENRANEQYTLSLDKPQLYVNDFKHKIIKTST